MKLYVAKKNILTTLFLLIICIIVSLIVSMDKARPEYYTNLWLLPLVYGITLTISSLISHNAWENVFFILMSMVFGIRNVITPLAMRFGQYSGYFRINSIDTVNKAILLMIFDSTVLLIYCAIKSKKAQGNYAYTIPVLERTGKEDICFFLATAFALSMIVFRRDFLEGFSTIINAINSRLYEESATSQGVMYTLFNVLFPISYLYISLYLMSRINAAFKSNKIRGLFNIICVCIPFLFMNGSDGFNIICVVCLGFAALKMNGISKNTLIYVILGFVGIIVLNLLIMIVGLSFNSASLSNTAMLSRALQAYFPGVCNFAGFFNLGSHNKLESFFYDIYYTIPFRNKLFGIEGDKRLVYYLTKDNGAISQILPCGAQFYYYFSLFGPLLECLFVKRAQKRYLESQEETNIYVYFCKFMTFIFLVLSLVMYNFTIFMSRYLATILPFMILGFFVKRKRQAMEEFQ